VGALEVDKRLTKGKKQEKMMAEETRVVVIVFGGAREETKAGKPGGNL